MDMFQSVTEEKLAGIKWPQKRKITGTVDTNMDTNEKGATASMP